MALTRRTALKRTPLRVKRDAAVLTVKPKMRKCANKACRAPFEKRSMAHVACGVECAIVVGKEKQAKEREKALKAERLVDRARKEAIKTIGELKAEAQVVFNAYIRYRDKDRGCIDCGKPFQPQKHGGSIDAGHYLSRGSADHLRFDERNVFGQRKNCNRPGGTTRAAFRAGVEARIGKEALEALEADQAVVKWDREYLISLKATYRAKLKALKEANNERTE